MKKVTAIIKPFRLEEVRDALSQVGIKGLTISEVQGIGRQRGHSELYRGAEYEVSYVPKLKIEVVITDDMLQQVCDTIIEKARTGNIGDGKIFVKDVEKVIRIRTGEKGQDAL